jgi:hypothetical protein
LRRLRAEFGGKGDGADGEATGSGRRARWRVDRREARRGKRAGLVGGTVLTHGEGALEGVGGTEGDGTRPAAFVLRASGIPHATGVQPALYVVETVEAVGEALTQRVDFSLQV